MTNNKSNSLKKGLFITLEIIAILIALVLAVFAIRSEVKSEIKSITSDEEFLKDLASKINPYMIFDEDGCYLVDGGAYKYIDDIIIEKGDLLGENNVKAPVKIIIKANQILSFAPQLRCIDSGDEYDIDVKQGEKNSWVFDLQLFGYNIPRRVNKFRIDIIP